MKFLKRYQHLFIVLTGLVFMSIYYQPEEYTAYKPVLMEREELEKSIAFLSSQPLLNTGKIYYKDEFVFISEKYKGIHVIDNSDSLAPEKTGFIRIPGCIDMAIKKNILYADNAVDLIALELVNNESVRVTKRIKNVFPELTPPGYDYVPWNYDDDHRPEGTIIVEWKKNREDIR